MVEKKEEKIGEALMKVALGYQLTEVTEEYAEVDGELKLSKRKKTKKDVPPDLKAVQILMSADGDGDFSKLSDAELEEERQRLLSALSTEEKKAAPKKERTSVQKTTKTTKQTESGGQKKRAKPLKRVVRKTKS